MTAVASPLTTATPVATESGEPIALERRIVGLAALGAVLLVLVLPPLHAGLFLLNAAWAFSAQPPHVELDPQIRIVLLGESLYLLVKFQLPRNPPAASPLFRHVFPSNEYALFLWTALEIVFFLRLLDFVLCRVGDLGTGANSPWRDSSATSCTPSHSSPDRSSDSTTSIAATARAG